MSNNDEPPSDDGPSEVRAVITGLWEGAKECGRLSDYLLEVALELAPVDEEGAAAARSQSIDASHVEMRLDSLADDLRHKLLRR